MTKKIFAQPEMMVVNICKNDIIATSGEGVASGNKLGGEYLSTDVSYAPGQRGIFDPYDAGY